MEIGLIEAAWEGTPFEGMPGLIKAKEMGFQAIDVAWDPVDKPSEAVQARSEDLKRCGLPTRSVVCVALGIAGDYNPAVQRFHVERAKRHLDFAAQIDARNLLLVIGEYIWQQEVIPASDQWADAVRNTREVSKYAEALDLEIALELEPWKFAFLNSIDKGIRLMDEVAVDACKVNLDLSHLWPMGASPDQIAALAGRISHAHISDTHGEVYENLPPGRGTAPLAEYLAALSATGYEGTVAVELGPAPAGENVVDWVAEAFLETTRLVQRGPAGAPR